MTNSAASILPIAPMTSWSSWPAASRKFSTIWAICQLLRGNKKKARTLLLEAKQGMADTTVVDANLEMLKQG